MNAIHAVTVIAVIAAVTWLATLKLTPERQVIRVLRVDTVTVHIQKDAELCSSKFIRDIQDLENDGTYQDVPKLVAIACATAR